MLLERIAEAHVAVRHNRAVDLAQSLKRRLYGRPSPTCRILASNKGSSALGRQLLAPCAEQLSGAGQAVELGDPLGQGGHRSSKLTMRREKPLRARLQAQGRGLLAPAHYVEDPATLVAALQLHHSTPGTRVGYLCTVRATRLTVPKPADLAEPRRAHIGPTARTSSRAQVNTRIAPSARGRWLGSPGSTSSLHKAGQGRSINIGHDDGDPPDRASERS